MKFRQHQDQAQTRTTRLFVWFALLLTALVVAINGVLALVYKLVMPFAHGFPTFFFETNTGIVLLFVVGGCLVETQRLREGGGPRLARWLGGREVTDGGTPLERRLLNVVDEMALASGQRTPQVFVMPREDAINAFVAGWADEDTVLCVTQGALERLNRAELQGLVAHEFGHIKEGDLRLTMRLVALVWGLSLVHGYGQTLMSPNAEGRISPPVWAIGVVFAIIGWLGWLAGRILQAAVSRQREFLADADAIQFTRTRDGLGNVLRKIWSDQNELADRIRSPHAEMVTAMLMHEPRWSRWLSSHPALPVRIERICGAVLRPMPAPPLHENVQEARRVRSGSDTPLPMPEGVLAAAALHASSGMAVRADPTQISWDHSPEAIERLHRLTGPAECNLAVLAIMMSPDNPAEQKMWRRRAKSVAQADQILQAVQALHPAARLPEFERLCQLISQGSLPQRRELVEGARDLMRADGRISPMERLMWLSLRHYMDDQQAAQAPLRPVTALSRDLTELTPHERQYVMALTAYLARFVPERETPTGPSLKGLAWYTRVMNRCVDTATNQSLPAWEAPDADGLVNAIAGVQEMSWILKPVLLRAWVEESLNHSPNGLLSDDTADALRLVAGLINSPMPPALASHYNL